MTPSERCLLAWRGVAWRGVGCFAAARVAWPPLTLRRATCQAHTEAEAAKAELKELRFKFEGSETALAMAQQRMKSAEGQVVELTTDLERAARRRDELEAVQAACLEHINKEAAELKLKLPKSDGLEKRIEAVLEQ